MIISNIECASLLPLLSEILQIRKTMEEAVANGKIRELTLGSDSNSVLLQHSVLIDLSDLTMMDIDLLQKSASNFIIKKSDTHTWHISANMYPIHVKLNDHMELLDYVKEYTSISSSMANDEALSEKNRMHLHDLGLIPIGSYKYEGIAIYTGINILSLFNGFLESTLCRITNNPDDVWTAEFREKLESVMADNFMNSLVSAAKSDSLRLSLMENVINDSRYDYLPNTDDTCCIMSQINYHEGIFNFLGVSSSQFMDGIYRIREFKKIRYATSNLPDYATIQYICRFQLKDLVVLKYILRDFVKFHSIDSFEVLYKKANIFDINKLSDEIKSRYLNRIIININHYEECKKLAEKDPVLNAPINKYNLLYECTPCRCMMEIDVSHLHDVSDYLTKILDGGGFNLNRLAVDQIKQALNKSHTFLSKI